MHLEPATPLAPWSATAVNLAEHDDNPVHTDEGARDAGFPAAIVAGTTVHACLIRPVVEGWGLPWLTAGWSEVRFRAPVFDGDRIECVPVSDGAHTIVEGRVNGSVRATLAVEPIGPAVEPQHGDRLPAMSIDLGSGAGGYGVRAGDDLPLYGELGLAHPAAWTFIGNIVTKDNFVDGPWVHVRSAIRHVAPAPADAEVDVTSTLTDRRDSRAGERVVLDVRISIDGALIAVVEHESIVRLSAT